MASLACLDGCVKHSCQRLIRLKRNSKLLLLREKIQAKFQVFAADEKTPVCLCGRINFGSVLRRGTTLRGASALTDFEHTALLFVENLHILGTSNTQKSVIRGSNLVSKQLRMKEGLPCPGQVLGVGLDRYQGGKVNLHFYKTTWVRLQFVRSTFLCF